MTIGFRRRAVAAVCLGFSTAAFGHGGIAAAQEVTAQEVFAETMLRASDFADEPTDSIGEYESGFGQSVALGPDGTVVVFAQKAAGLTDDYFDKGAIYIYKPKPGGGYTESKLLTRGTPTYGQNHILEFMDDGTLVIGMPHTDGLGVNNNIGAVLVLRPDGDGSYEQVRLTPPDPVRVGDFGIGVGVLSGGRIVVAATLTGNGQSAIYIYEPDSSGGYSVTEVDVDLEGIKIIADFAAGADGTIAAMIGANGQTGRHVLILRPTSSGGYSARLVEPGAGARNGIVRSVEVADDGTVAIGVPYFRQTLATRYQGRVFFYRPGLSTLDPQILEYDGQDDGEYVGFGAPISLTPDGSKIAVAASESVAGQRTGTVRIYDITGQSPQLVTSVGRSDRELNAAFGSALAFGNDGVLVVGSLRQSFLIDGRITGGIGAAYVYDLNTSPDLIEACSYDRTDDQIDVKWSQSEADDVIVSRQVDGGSAYWRGRAAAASGLFTDSTRGGDLTYSVVGLYGSQRGKRIVCTEVEESGGGPGEGTGPEQEFTCSWSEVGSRFVVDWSGTDPAGLIIIERNVNGGTWWWRGRSDVSMQSFADGRRSGEIAYRLRIKGGPDAGDSTLCQ